MQMEVRTLSDMFLHALHKAHSLCPHFGEIFFLMKNLPSDMVMKIEFLFFVDDVVSPARHLSFFVELGQICC